MPTKPDKKTPEKQPEEAPLQNDMRDRTSRDEASDTQPVQYGFSQEAETSLGWLRDRIDFPMTMFGAAYLGYVGGLFDEGFEAGFSSWLWETNAAMLLEYPFIAEIDETHIIGGAGYLYCIGSIFRSVLCQTVWHDEQLFYHQFPCRCIFSKLHLEANRVALCTLQCRQTACR